MKSVFEPFNALLLIGIAVLAFCFKPAVRTAFKPVLNSKRSMAVKLRFFSKLFNKQFPFLAPSVAVISGLFYVLFGTWEAASIVLFVCALPVMFPTPSNL